MTTSHEASDLARTLQRNLPTRDEHLAALHARLAAAADAEGVLDVAYRTVDTPVGSLLLAATERGLVRIAYASENHDVVLQMLANRISPRLLHAPARLDAVATELEEYFAGDRRAFDFPLDWQLSSGFRNTVLHHLAVDIGYGQTASYTTVARLAGQSQGGSRRRHRLRHQPAAGRRPLSPRRAVGRFDWRLPRRHRR